MIFDKNINPFLSEEDDAVEEGEDDTADEMSEEDEEMDEDEVDDSDEETESEE